jgi:hypothetical protein
MSGRWVDLREAAELLSTSTEAVRKRATRGSLRSDRHDGRAVVWVDAGRTEGGREAQVDGGSLLEAKDETIAILRDQLRLRAEEIQRRDVIVSQLAHAGKRSPGAAGPRAGAHPGAPRSPGYCLGDADGTHTLGGKRSHSGWIRAPVVVAEDVRLVNEEAG